MYINHPNLVCRVGNPDTRFLCTNWFLVKWFHNKFNDSSLWSDLRIDQKEVDNGSPTAAIWYVENGSAYRLALIYSKTYDIGASEPLAYFPGWQGTLNDLCREADGDCCAFVGEVELPKRLDGNDYAQKVGGDLVSGKMLEFETMLGPRGLLMGLYTEQKELITVE